MGNLKKFLNASLILAIIILFSTFASALVPQVIERTVTEKNGYASGYYNVKQNGNRLLEWTTQIKNLGPGDMHVVSVAFHDNSKGSGPTTASNAGGFHSTGKEDYIEGESGTLVSTFDTRNYNCGRVQLDIGFIDARTMDYQGPNFVAFLIDYDVDCTSQPTTNHAPIISSCNPTSSSITLGRTATINYVVTDPDNDAVTITIDWGDGTTPSTGGANSATHVYSRTGTFVVAITATDSKGAISSSGCRMITVTQDTTPSPCVAPTGLSPSSAITISGDNGNVDLSWNAVPGAVSYNVRLQDGTNDRYDDPRFQTCPSSPHYYCENGISSTRITNVPVKAGRNYLFWIDPIFSPARDYCNGQTQFSVDKITLTNRPPVISSCSPPPGSAILGIPAAISYSVSDPDGDSFTVRIDWGDGETSNTNNPSSSTHTYSKAGTFAVTLTATDSKGASSQPKSCGSVTVTPTNPNNNPPVINSCNTFPGAILGIPVQISYSVSDPENDAVSVTIDWGDGTTPSTGGANAATHTYSKTGTFTVKLTATDSKGATSNKDCGSITVSTSSSNNPPVISSCNPSSSSITLGSTATINYVVTDPDGDSFTVKIDWGDGTTPLFGSSTSASHVYLFAGTFSVTITATDSRSATSSISCKTITVTSTTPTNNPPIISFCNPVGTIVKLGTTATLTYSVSDPEGDAVTVKIDWGDGTFSFGTLTSASHVYAAAGIYFVTIIAKDSKGASASSSCGAITVTLSSTNNPPIIFSCNPVSSPIILGNTATIIYSVSDPDGDSVSVLINWGDGSITKGGSSSASHVYTSTGTFSVSIKAVDSKGAVTSSSCSTINVISSSVNNPPSISSCNPSSPSVTLGSTTTINYGISDPEGDSFSVTINWGDGSTSTGGLSSASHIYSSAGTFSVTIIATDSKGASNSKTCGSITVTSSSTNNPPVISSCNPSSSSITSGSTATISYSISDPNGDSFSVLVDWGDGTTTSGGTSSASHVYSSAGTFSVTITATDSKGASSSRNCGSIIVTSGGGPGPTPPSSGAALKIISVDAKIDGRTSSGLHDGDTIGKKAKPASKVEFKSKIRNLFNSTNGLRIRDIKVKTTIEGVDNGDDMEDESSSFDLRPQNEKSVTARFDLPLNVEEGTYTVSIQADGEDTNGNSQSDSVNIDLEVKKDKHDLRFMKLDLSKLKINCNESFNANYQIINLGQEDERQAVVELRNDDLGIDFTQKDISVKSGTTGNTFAKSQPLRITNKVEDGSYTITATATTDDGKITDTRTAQLNVQNCGREEKTTTEKTPTFASSTSTTQFTGTQTSKTVYEIPFIDIFRSGDYGLLIITTFILSIFFLIVACVLLARDEYEE